MRSAAVTRVPSSGGSSLAMLVPFSNPGPARSTARPPTRRPLLDERRCVGGAAVEERGGFAQVRRVEAFAEPAVDRGQHLPGLGMSFPAAQKSTQADGGTELERSRLLPVRDVDRAPEVPLRFGVVRSRRRRAIVLGEQLAPEAMQLGLEVALSMALQRSERVPQLVLRVVQAPDADVALHGQRAIGGLVRAGA